MEKTFEDDVFAPFKRLVRKLNLGKHNKLIRAIRANDLEQVRALVKKGASVNGRYMGCSILGEKDWPPLIAAINNQGYSLEMVKLLLDLGASPNQCITGTKQDCVTLAIGRPELVVELFKHGAIPKLRTLFGMKDVCFAEYMVCHAPRSRSMGHCVVPTLRALFEAGLFDAKKIDWQTIFCKKYYSHNTEPDFLTFRDREFSDYTGTLLHHGPLELIELLSEFGVDFSDNGRPNAIHFMFGYLASYIKKVYFVVNDTRDAEILERYSALMEKLFTQGLSFKREHNKSGFEIVMKQAKRGACVQRLLDHVEEMAQEEERRTLEKAMAVAVLNAPIKRRKM
ncbi:ankyrin repeat domain-containing protein [Pseudoxanthomonas winnipegensis]|uniref:Ankyrin repeat domain-containing protein n=1 Tax=Pseudoxanthomonas winnipegensis TaxID=2480810 RepID=A0A4Q8M2K9_9GAMM|nr:ankyrin repeat domain-containing protein [Pseudoxanthomonas winnipegensis]TAA41553.1 ankyrin repeat domain-containing protein [Pseudoxanthomonas winnipegensis]